MRYALLAYVAWGFFPIYWKLLGDLPAIEILCHRIAWSFVFYCLYLVHSRERLMGLFQIRQKIWARMFFTSILLTANWLIYIWAINDGQVIETSLGYFINPLVNVALGVIVLKERLSKPRWLALLLATLGVLWLSFLNAAPPWIALSLALTFGVYGFLKKITPVDSARGGQMESLLMILPAAIAILVFRPHFHGLPYPGWDLAWLILSGLVTGLPLIWFADAAQIVPLNLLGFTQYISPSLQFLIGLLLYGEPFGRDQLIGFSLIWAALAIFAVDLWLASTDIADGKLFKPQS